MQESEKKYLELAEKWLNGTISPQEKQLFSDWYNSKPDGDILLQELTGNNRTALKERMFENIASETGLKNRSDYSIIKYAAAIVFICVSISAAFLISSKDESASPKTVASQQLTDIPAPNLSKALLTLDDGTQFYIDSIENGIMLPIADNSQILKSNDGSLVYSQKRGASTKAKFNTLSVPRGSQIVHITLSDGTKVWLNTESSIRFPVFFDNDSRIVEITGEVYFEVSRDVKRKFFVQCGDFVTEVLGTSFNINMHKDDGTARVTLLEGAVKVAMSATSQSVNLQPGQQATIQSSISKSNAANIRNAVAWKDGWFIFDNLNIISITQQLARWYDIDFVFSGDLAKKHFTGRISKNESTSEVLKMLELTEAIKFRIDGKNVTISPYDAR